MLPLNNKNKFLRVTHTCSKIIGLPTPSLPALINTATIRKSLHIAHDPHHPLHPYFILLPSGWWFRQLSCRTTRFCKIFIPSAITGGRCCVFLFLYMYVFFLVLHVCWCLLSGTELSFPLGTINHESESESLVCKCVDKICSFTLFDPVSQKSPPH